MRLGRHETKDGMDGMEYCGFRISVSTSGDGPGQNFRSSYEIRRTGDALPIITGAIAGNFSTLLTAEEAALKQARRWIDEQGREHLRSSGTASAQSGIGFPGSAAHVRTKSAT